MMGFQVSEFSCPWGLCSGCKICWGFFALPRCVVFRWGAEKRPTNRCVSHLKTGILCSYLGVSKKCGTPKWMVYNGKPYIFWMIWGETHHLRKHPNFHPTIPLFCVGTSVMLWRSSSSRPSWTSKPRENAVDQLWQGRKIWGCQMFPLRMTQFS